LNPSNTTTYVNTVTINGKTANARLVQQLNQWKNPMPNQVRISGGPNAQWYILTVVAFLLWGLKGLLIWFGITLGIVLSSILYFRYRHIAIIPSLLDTDWYKLTMGQVVFHQFPNANAIYQFINRGKTKFPEGFDEALRKELKYLSKLRLTDYEWMWLSDQWVLKPDYIKFLENYRFDLSQVAIEQKDGDLNILIKGPWVETILWEVPLMALISELYFRLTGKTCDMADFHTKTIAKADKMLNAGVKWSDFGTRRRFSFATQDALNEIMKNYTPGYIGTSNPFFAMKYNLRPIGTYAHEAVMAMQVKYSPTESNEKWMQHWLEEYCMNPNLLTALTDTLTTDVFLRTFRGDLANKFSAVRQDSGDPFAFAPKLIEHYKSIGVRPKDKKIVFSDSLDTDKACALHKAFNDEIPCLMGIGTHLTNDCGHKPLNMVIKLAAIDFGEGFKTVVKLSDDHGKYTGDVLKIESVKKELGI
jgi:nicotinate phosphoribosyltransferase